MGRQHHRVRSATRLTAGVVAVASLFWCNEATAVSVPTIYDNGDTYPIGSRAAGMGGAYTALACDEASLFYNPAALACAENSRLELSANVYVLRGINIPNAFGDGQNIDSINYHSVPAIVGGVRVLSDGDKETAVGRLVFGLSVAVPRSLSIEVEPAQPENPNSITATVRDDLTTFEIGLGYQVTPQFSLGLGIGAGLRTYSATVSSLFLARNTVPCGPALAGECLEFIGDFTDEESLAVGGHAKLGARLLATKELSLGLTVTSPSLNLFGSSQISSIQTLALDVVDDANNIGTVFGPVVARVDGGSDLSLPMRIALGAAYSTPSFTVSADISGTLPHTVAIAKDLEGQRIRGFATPTDLADVELRRNFVPNAAVGVEFAVAEDVAIDIGAFTDLSGTTQEEVDRDISNRIHQFGGSVALGLLGKITRGYFGVSGKGGAGETTVPGGSIDLDTILAEPPEERSTITTWSVSGFIGSNYSFSED